MPLEERVTETRNVSFLSAAHAEGLRVLSREPDFSAAAGIGMSLSVEEAAAYIDTITKARDEGRTYIFALTRGHDVLGVCRLIGVLGVPRVIVSIGGAYRGQGNGSFIVRHVLEFAFDTLQLERVTAGGACLRLLGNFGQVEGNGLTRQEWQAARSKVVG